MPSVLAGGSIEEGGGMSSVYWGRAFIAVMAIAFILLVLRSFGLYVTVIGDEYTYANLSRNVPLSESTVPGYIYLLVFSLTKLAGTQYLEFGRILNALLYSAGAGFVYLTASRFTTPALAFLAALLALVGPFNSYTVYFMPEAMYFFGFWGVFWFLVRAPENNGVAFWAGAGMLLGLISLIKPHALFVLPAMFCYIVYVSYFPRTCWLRSTVLRALTFLVCLVFTKMAVGYLFAGKAGLSMLGGLYGSVAESTSSKVTNYFDILKLVLVSLQGHGLALVVMYSIPMAILSFAVVRYLFKGKEGGRNEALEILVALIFLNLLAVVVVFSGFVSINGNGESISRLHMRYYNFIFPMFTILVAARYSSAENKDGVAIRSTIGFLIVLAGGYSIYEFFGIYTPGLVDSPEYRGFTYGLNSFYWLGGLSLTAVVAWLFKPRLGGALFLFAYLPIMTVVTSWFVNEDVRQRLEPTVFDRAGVFAKYYIPKSEVSELVAVGDDASGLYKTLFYLDNYNASVSVVLPGEAVNFKDIAADNKWLLVIGDHPVHKYNMQLEASMAGFRLYKTKKPIELDFSSQNWRAQVSEVEGLSTWEAWGVWSQTKSVRFDFQEALPRNIKVQLTAKAFGPNVGKEFVLQIDGARVPFTLGEYPEEREFLIQNPGMVSSMKIIIPNPTAPKALGYGEDVRELGIGLVRLRVAPSAGTSN